MRRSEAATLVAHCKELWGTAFKTTNDTPDVWAQHAADLHPSLIKQALDLYAGEGREFPPPLATLMARARGLRPRQEWTSGADMQCHECSGPTPVNSQGSRSLHFAFCPTYGTGEYQLTKPATDPEWHTS